MKYNKTYILDILAIIFLTFIFLFPIYIGGINDEEGLRVPILSTKLVLSSWQNLSYNFWTNRLGLGIPLPFSHDLTMHPLSIFFLSDDLYLPVSFFYTFHI